MIKFMEILLHIIEKYTIMYIIDLNSDRMSGLFDIHKFRIIYYKKGVEPTWNLTKQ